MNNNINIGLDVTQRELLYKFNDENRERFNPQLFKRDEDRIVEELKKIILSCQRNKKYIIKIESFEVVENYEEMMNLLIEYDNLIYPNSKKKLNQFEYVSLKDSEFKLLKINYYLEVKEKFTRFTALVLTPKIVEKYYFKISGSMYYAMFQIADGTTYNNNTSNNSCSKITLRPTFNPLKIYKKEYILTTIEGENVEFTYYLANVSNKLFDACKYILAKYGLFGTFKEMKLPYIYFDKEPNKNSDVYCFKVGKNIYMYSPRYIVDRDLSTQSLICTIYRSLKKESNCSFEDIFGEDFWLESLGNEFTKTKKSRKNKAYQVKSKEKGLSTLESLESLYDIPSKESYRLPPEIKKDIYHILIWIIREFNNLKLKNNLDLSTKKIKYAEYIASLYSMKLIRGIYRLDNSKVSLESIIKVVRIKPTYLLESITKCKLIKYRELVNDLDSMIATKFTNKYVSGIYETDSKRGLSPVFRYIYPSHLGIIDLDASPKSDPGISGSLVPTAKIYDGYFDKDFKEPNFWEEEFKVLSETYRKITGQKEIFEFQKEVLDMDVDEKIEDVTDDIMTVKALAKPVMDFLENPFEPVK